MVRSDKAKSHCRSLLGAERFCHYFNIPEIHNKFQCKLVYEPLYAFWEPTMHILLITPRESTMFISLPALTPVESKVKSIALLSERFLDIYKCFRLIRVI